MRILITSSYKPNSETGTSQVGQELALSLSKNHKVMYLCLGKKSDKQKINRNLTYLYVPSLDLGRMALPLITPGLIFDLDYEFGSFKPDIIHAQNPIFTSRIAQIWAKKNKIPFVITFHHIPTEAVHHLLPKLSKNIFTKLAQEFYTQVSLKKFLTKTDGVIALNKAVRKSIKKVDKNIKIAIINNGLDLTKYLKLKTKSLSDSKNINFFFLGSYTQRKNQEYLIKVFSKLPSNFVLNCYGNKKTGKDYYLKLKLLKIKLKTENVFLNDYVEIKKLYKIIDNQHFFVSASLKEAQSLAIIISLSSSKPVIGLKNETTVELIDKFTGLIFPKNTSPKVFAKSLQSFINKADYNLIADNCRKKSLEFDVNKTTKSVVDFYQKIISDKTDTNKFRDRK